VAVLQRVTGVADAATSSEAAAKAMQLRLKRNFRLSDFFPETLDLPENLTVEDFRRNFDHVGSEKYRFEIAEMEAALESCEALSGTKHAK